MLFNTFNSHFVEESNKKNGTYFTLNLNNLRMLNVFVSDVWVANAYTHIWSKLLINYMPFHTKNESKVDASEYKICLQFTSVLKMHEQFHSKCDKCQLLTNNYYNYQAINLCAISFSNLKCNESLQFSDDIEQNYPKVVHNMILL